MARIFSRLFLRLFVLRVSTAPTTVLLELNFALDELPVFARPIINTAALTAREFYELILGHSRRTISTFREIAKLGSNQTGPSTRPVLGSD